MSSTKHVRERFQKIQSYAVYYGYASDMPPPSTEVMILEPAGQTDESLAALRGRGVILLAYVSVMEAGPHLSLWSELQEGDFLHTDQGERLARPEYENYIMDLTSPHWRGLVHFQVGKALADGRYDGVFLDTIGNVEIPGLSSQPHQVDAAVSIVKQIRRWFPDTILVQNNGLELLLGETAPYLDGVMWESPPLFKKKSDAWVTAMTRFLDSQMRKHPIRILVLFEGADSWSRQQWIVGRSFADEHKFVCAFASRHYLGQSITEIKPIR